MTLYSQGELRSELRRDEGCKLFPYVDTAGKLTIGVGWNLSDNGLPTFIVEELLTEGIQRAKEVVEGLLPEWQELSDARQRVLLNMAYNLGRKLGGFRRFLGAVEADDFEAAASEMRRSRWAKQVGKRAERLATMMEEG